MKKQLKKINKMIVQGKQLKQDLKKDIEIAYMYNDSQLLERCVASKAKANKILRELHKAKKDIMLSMAENTESKNLTKDAASPVAELSRLLQNDFEETTFFGTVNSKTIANLIGRKLSNDKIHEAVLKNFPGIKFRKQNGAYAYTLNYQNRRVSQ